MINTVLKMFMDEYSDAMGAVGQKTMDTGVRDAANKLLADKLAAPPPCGAPQDTYASGPASSAFIVLSVIGVGVALLTIPKLFKCLASKNTPSVNPLLDGDSS